MKENDNKPLEDLEPLLRDVVLLRNELDTHQATAQTQSNILQNVAKIEKQLRECEAMDEEAQRLEREINQLNNRIK